MRHLASLVAVAITGGLTAVVVDAGNFNGAAVVAVLVAGGAIASAAALAIDPLQNERRDAPHHRR